VNFEILEDEVDVVDEVLKSPSALDVALGVEDIVALHFDGVELETAVPPGRVLDFRAIRSPVS
jgi:hypothetical protein